MEKRLKHKKWGKDNIYHKKNKKKEETIKNIKQGKKESTL